jgi:multimeric flavodoxin WrbA
MSNTIVVLSGSPRKSGNTDKLADAFVNGARSREKTVTLFRVADMTIGGCRGCGYCFENKGVCVQKDDMFQILDVLRKADAIVFASPVYYFDMSAQLKLAIDRTYALLKENIPVKRAALLMTCGDKSADAAEGAVVTYNHILSFQKWDNAGVIVAPGLHAKDDINGRKELEMAGKLGREI